MTLDAGGQAVGHRCFEQGPELHLTCLLPLGHDGPHEFVDECTVACTTRKETADSLQVDAPPATTVAPLLSEAEDA